MAEPRPPSSASTLVRVARGLPLGLTLAATLYAGLKSTPEMRTFPALPPAWGDWLDEHDFFKNACGFAVLAVASHLAFSRRVGRNVLVLATLVVAIEIAQLFLPGRHSDANDVAAGWLGVGFASGVWIAVARQWSRERR